MCSQCIKANRGNECKYHDKKQISRTQLLQQKVAKLEARLRELELEQLDFPDGSPAPSYVESAASSSSASSPSLTLVHPGEWFGPRCFCAQFIRPMSDGLQNFAPPSDWSSQIFDDAVFPELTAPFSPFFPSQSSSTATSPSDTLDPSSLYLSHGYSQSASVYPSLNAPSNGSSTLKWWEDSNTFCQQKQML